MTHQAHSCKPKLLGTYHLDLPPGPPSHTKVILFACECGKVDPFPPENWKLATPEERRRVLAGINSQLHE